MRKKIVMIMVAMIAMVSVFAFGEIEVSESTMQIEAATKMAQDNAVAAVPVPVVTNFTERKTIARWTERWDKPSVVTYVYLISYGNILGYYVCNGKPASTQSYLIPETKWEDGHDLGEYYGEVQVEAQDIDGTYGTLNPGIRFFTAEGTAVEWGGSGATYLYSDAPLPLNVPKLNYAEE